MIDNLNKIYALANFDVREKNVYIPYVKKIEDFVLSYPMEEKHFARFLNVNQNEELNTLENIVSNKNENFDYNKFGIWLEHIYWSIWKYFQYGGLGHLSTFEVRGNVIYCEVHLNFELRKNLSYGQSKEYFEKKKLAFEKKLVKLGITKKKTMVGSLAVYDKYSVDFIKEYLQKYFDYSSIKYELHEDCIYKISFYIKNIDVSLLKIKEEKQEEKSALLTDAELENIIDICKHWGEAYYTNLNCEKDIEKKSFKELRNTCIQSFFTYYNSLCLLFDVKNEFSSKYRELLPISREKSLSIQELKNSICSNCEVSILLDTNKLLKSALENYCLKNYCLHLETFVNSFEVVGTLKWSSYYYNLLKYKDDFEKNESLVDYDKLIETFYIPAFVDYDDSKLYNVKDNLSKIEHIVTNELNGKVENITLGYDVNGSYISEVQFSIKDFEGTLNKFLS